MVEIDCHRSIKSFGKVKRILCGSQITRIDPTLFRWCQPEIALWWDGIQLDDREDWNEDWAIVDGAGYFDIQETPDGGLAFVESNKLTVRYHEIPPGVVGIMKDQLSVQSGAMGGSAVFKWSGNPGWHRSPVLPDLRAGGGFTLVCWVKLTALPGAAGSNVLLVDGTRAVSGSLDEEEAEDITKGFTVTAEVGGGIRLFITDGFNAEFEFRVAIQWDKKFALQ